MSIKVGKPQARAQAQKLAWGRDPAQARGPRFFYWHLAPASSIAYCTLIELQHLAIVFQVLEVLSAPLYKALSYILNPITTPHPKSRKQRFSQNARHCSGTLEVFVFVV